jgi:signal transduction histidine kinase
MAPSVISPGGFALRALIDAAIEAAADELNMPILYIDLKSQKWIGPVDSLNRFSGYCKAMWDSPLHDRCIQDHLTRASIADGQNLTTRLCFAGRYNFAIPVQFKDERVGTVLAGQLAPPPSFLDEARRRHITVVRSRGVTMDEREVLTSEFLRSGPARSSKQTEDVLRTLANRITEYYRLIWELYPDVALTPGEFTDPWSMMVHELQNDNQALMATAEELHYAVRKLPRVSNIEYFEKRSLEILNNLLIMDLKITNLFGDRVFGYPAQSKVPINVLFSEAVDVFKGIASRKKIAFAPRLGIDTFVRGAEDYLRVLALNLVGNAVKYSYPGTAEDPRIISIRIATTAKMGEVSVSNYGVGILDHEKEEIFKKFVRLPRARRHNGSGSGIGLFAVKSIVDSHAGKISVESSPVSNQGENGPHLVVFKVSLPLV